MPNDITRFYRQCDPAEPLPSGDPRYVSCDEARGGGDVVRHIANDLQRSEKPQHILFAGHRGGGKSTELLRLKHFLENPLEDGDKFFVVHFESDSQDIDVNDADFPDILLAMIRHVSQALREGPVGEDLRGGLIGGFVNRLKDCLSSLEFADVQLGAGYIAQVTATIKSSPTSRRQIRDALEPHVSGLIEEANRLLDDAVVRLKSKGYRDLVIIVDNLDRIILRDLEGGTNTHRRFFLDRATQLNSLRCHVVYTLPLSIVFSPDGAGLGTTFGRGPDVLPMVKVINQDGSDDRVGIDAVRDMVRKRLEAADVTEGEAFDSHDTLDHLCRMSGGHVRNLLILLRYACSWLDDLPITRDVAERAARNMSNDFERALNRPEYFDVLRQVDETHSLPGSEHEQSLLYNLSILEYLNGESWYTVNPAVKQLRKFKAPSNSPSRRRRTTAGSG
jgi:hypothetical protein